MGGRGSRREQCVALEVNPNVIKVNPWALAVDGSGVSQRLNWCVDDMRQAITALGVGRHKATNHQATRGRAGQHWMAHARGGHKWHLRHTHGEVNACVRRTQAGAKEACAVEAQAIERRLDKG